MKRKSMAFSKMVQDGDTMFIDVVPMEAINEADMKAKVTLMPRRLESIAAFKLLK